MARRSKRVKPITRTAQLQQALKLFLDDYENLNLRQRVDCLIEPNFMLRDIGSSLMPKKYAGSARQRILFYLKEFVGEKVRGEELMVVSGISEYARRIRELRVEHGWQIISGLTLKDMAESENQEDAEGIPKLKPDEYILLNRDRDEDAAARWKSAKAIRNEKLSVQNKILKYLKENVGKPISGEELKYLAKDKSEWARRVRELRTEQGWSVATKSTGRPDLPVGIYVLEDLRQAPEHDRHIKDDVRGRVLRRDEYKCQDCDWSRDIWHPDDPRHLEVHHLVMHAKGGENTEANLITLCNICHDVRHRSKNMV